MKKNIFLIVILTALCLFTYGCGNHEIESESSAPIVESTANTALHTELTSTSKNNLILKTETSVSQTSSKSTVTTATTAAAAGTSRISESTTPVTSVTFKSPSGETEFKIITNQHAQYEARVPSVLKPHEPVIYTTAPVTTAAEETTTTVSSDTEYPTDTNPEENTETTTSEDNSGTTEPEFPPDPISDDEIYFLGMTIGDDILDIINSLGEYESLNSTPGEYDADGVQTENRRYFYSNMELVTCWTENYEILKEIIVKDSSYSTSRGISIGMTCDDIISLYGEGDSDGNTYRYYADNGCLYFHTDENGTVDYIGFCENSY